MGRSLLPFSCWWCVGGAGRGAVMGRSPAAFFFWLFVVFGVQLGVGHLLLCCIRGCS